jgi:hypothetical protein
MASVGGFLWKFVILCRWQFNVTCQEACNYADDAA